MRASDIRKGQAIRLEGKLFVVTNADHNTPGNLRAKVPFQLRDGQQGTIMDKRGGGRVEGRLCGVPTADHNAPGNLRAKVQCKLRDGQKGTIMDKRVGATDDID